MGFFEKGLVKFGLRRGIWKGRLERGVGEGLGRAWLSIIAILLTPHIVQKEVRAWASGPGTPKSAPRRVNVPWTKQELMIRWKVALPRVGVQENKWRSMSQT